MTRLKIEVAGEDDVAARMLVDFIIYQFRATGSDIGTRWEIVKPFGTATATVDREQGGSEQ